MKRTTIILLCVLALASCKATKQSKTDYQYTADEYTHTEHKVDTIRIVETVTVHDTVIIERQSESETGVQFVEGGGSYNIKTGEMTGVRYVTNTEREKMLESRISTLEGEVEKNECRIETLKDSLRCVQASGTEETFSETKAQNFWWVWLCIGLVGGAGAVIALKKIPYTSWMMRWL